MKKIVLLTMLASIGFAQRSISYITPKKDTLFLENSDVGQIIKQTWDCDLFVNEKEPTKPVIVMVDDINLFTKERKKKTNGKKK